MKVEIERKTLEDICDFFHEVGNTKHPVLNVKKNDAWMEIIEAIEESRKNGL